MSHESLIHEDDARDMVRLLGRIASAPETLPARKRLLMEGLSELIDADGWLWSVTRVLHDQSRPVSIGLLHGGLTDAQIAGWLEASQSNCPPPEDVPLAKEVLRGQHFTRTRQQVVPDEVWYTHPTVQRHRLAVGIDHFLYSIYPVPTSDVLSCLGFYRHKDRDPFTDRQRRLAHIITSEIPWLHEAGVPHDRGVSVPQLPPRRRAVLIMLLDGHDRKAIARLLRVKPTTAKEHIEAVYAHFGVSSQVELICRFTRGNGGDVA
jgi:DNA-binding CsgD family transcriptional regulator